MTHYDLSDEQIKKCYGTLSIKCHSWWTKPWPFYHPWSPVISLGYDIMTQNQNSSKVFGNKRFTSTNDISHSNMVMKREWCLLYINALKINLKTIICKISSSQNGGFCFRIMHMMINPPFRHQWNTCRTLTLQSRFVCISNASTWLMRTEIQHHHWSKSSHCC